MHYPIITVAELEVLRAHCAHSKQAGLINCLINKVQATKIAKVQAQREIEARALKEERAQAQREAERVKALEAERAQAQREVERAKAQKIVAIQENILPIYNKYIDVKNMDIEEFLKRAKVYADGIEKALESESPRWPSFNDTPANMREPTASDFGFGADNPYFRKIQSISYRI